MATLTNVTQQVHDMDRPSEIDQDSLGFNREREICPQVEDEKHDNKTVLQLKVRDGALHEERLVQFDSKLQGFTNAMRCYEAMPQGGEDEENKENNHVALVQQRLGVFKHFPRLVKDVVEELVNCLTHGPFKFPCRGFYDTRNMFVMKLLAYLIEFAAVAKNSALKADLKVIKHTHADYQDLGNLLQPLAGLNRLKQKWTQACEQDSARLDQAVGWLKYCLKQLATFKKVMKANRPHMLIKDKQLSPFVPEEYDILRAAMLCVVYVGGSGCLAKLGGRERRRIAKFPLVTFPSGVVFDTEELKQSWIPIRQGWEREYRRNMDLNQTYACKLLKREAKAAMTQDKRIEILFAQSELRAILLKRVAIHTKNCVIQNEGSGENSPFMLTESDTKFIIRLLGLIFELRQVAIERHNAEGLVQELARGTQSLNRCLEATSDHQELIKVVRDEIVQPRNGERIASTPLPNTQAMILCHALPRLGQYINLKDKLKEACRAAYYQQCVADWNSTQQKVTDVSCLFYQTSPRLLCEKPMMRTIIEYVIDAPDMWEELPMLLSTYNCAANKALDSFHSRNLFYRLDAQVEDIQRHLVAKAIERLAACNGNIPSGTSTLLGRWNVLGRLRNVKQYLINSLHTHYENTCNQAIQTFEISGFGLKALHESIRATKESYTGLTKSGVPLEDFTVLFQRANLAESAAEGPVAGRIMLKTMDFLFNTLIPTAKLQIVNSKDVRFHIQGDCDAYIVFTKQHLKKLIAVTRFCDIMMLTNQLLKSLKVMLVSVCQYFDVAMNGTEQYDVGRHRDVFQIAFEMYMPLPNHLRAYIGRANMMQAWRRFGNALWFVWLLKESLMEMHNEQHEVLLPCSDCVPNTAEQLHNELVKIIDDSLPESKSEEKLARSVKVTDTSLMSAVLESLDQALTSQQRSTLLGNCPEDMFVGGTRHVGRILRLLPLMISTPDRNTGGTPKTDLETYGHGLSVTLCFMTHVLGLRRMFDSHDLNTKLLNIVTHTKAVTGEDWMPVSENPAYTEEYCAYIKQGTLLRTVQTQVLDSMVKCFKVKMIFERNLRRSSSHLSQFTLVSEESDSPSESA